MIPILTPDEMAAVDADADEPVDVLIRRAAGAVARAAVEMLGGTYGRRVVVVAGPGNNGNDGRVAAELLRTRGVAVRVIDVADAPSVLPLSDLVIDAAFGTGFRGTFGVPDPNGAPVLAVDIPSGLSGLTGTCGDSAFTAAATVTFAALKPGLVLADGPAHGGIVTVADIGLGVEPIATAHLVEDADVVGWIPDRDRQDHKWRHAVWCIAGSPTMSGAAHLCAAAAMRGGAGYVRLSTPGNDDPSAPTEAVVHPLDLHDWARAVADGAQRFGAVALGPGLGRAEHTSEQVRSLLRSLPVPAVVDGDALWALGDAPAEVLADNPGSRVLTPHDGEFTSLTGSAPGDDRLGAARDLARRTGSTVLLKGPTTIVADPDGQALFVTGGDQRLATAGTGDVLTGLVAAHLSAGAPPLQAAAAAALVHGRAAMHGPARGLIAGDLIELIPEFWTALSGDGPDPMDA